MNILDLILQQLDEVRDIVPRYSTPHRLLFSGDFTPLKSEDLDPFRLAQSNYGCIQSDSC
jgi:hypothetical protein